MPSLFDKLVGMLDEPDRAVFQKYPKVAAEISNLDEYATRWENWRKNEWDDDLKMPKAAAAAIRDKDLEIAALKAMQDTDMNWEEMETNVKTLLSNTLKTNGYISKEQFEKEI